MTRLEKLKEDLGRIQTKIRNLEKLEFNLQQKIEKLEKFPELNVQLDEKNSSNDQ